MNHRSLTHETWVLKLIRKHYPFIERTRVRRKSDSESIRDFHTQEDRAILGRVHLVTRSQPRGKEGGRPGHVQIILEV